MALLLVHAVDVLGEDRRVTVAVTLCDVNGDALVADVGGAEVLFNVERRGSELQFDLTPNADIDTPNTFYLVRILDGDDVLWSRVIEKASGTERVLDADSPTPAPTPDAPIALDDLSDVDSPTEDREDGQVFTWDADTSTAVFADPTAGSGVQGVTGTAPVTVDNTDPANPVVGADLSDYALQENLENAVGQLQGDIAAEAVLRSTADSTHAADTTSVHGIADTSALVLTNDSRLADSRTPSGAAGGVLGGTYPSPTFAVDMATQAELDAAKPSMARYAISSVAQWTIPSGIFTGDIGTNAFTANVDRFSPFWVDRAIVVDQLAGEVTTGSAGNARMGIVSLDEGLQGTGAPLFDSGNIDTTGTGVKTASTGGLTLQPGVYAIVMNQSAAATWRFWRYITRNTAVAAAMGATSLYFGVGSKSRTFAAFPTPTVWDTPAATATAGALTAALACPILLRVSDPSA